MIIGGVKIKFEIDANDVKLSADAIPAPKSYKTNKEIDVELREILDSLCRECKTLRDFMTCLVCYFMKELKIILLEDVLISIREKVKKSIA